MATLFRPATTTPASTAPQQDPDKRSLGLRGRILLLGIIGAIASLVIAVIALVNVSKMQTTTEQMRTLEKTQSLVQDIRFEVPPGA